MVIIKKNKTTARNLKKYEIVTREILFCFFCSFLNEYEDVLCVLQVFLYMNTI